MYALKVTPPSKANPCSLPTPSLLSVVLTLPYAIYLILHCPFADDWHRSSNSKTALTFTHTQNILLAITYRPNETQADISSSFIWSSCCQCVILYHYYYYRTCARSFSMHPYFIVPVSVECFYSMPEMNVYLNTSVFVPKNYRHAQILLFSWKNSWTVVLLTSV